MIPSTRNVLLELFDHSKSSLSDEKLDWMKGLSDTVESEAVNVAETLSFLGMIHGTAEPSDLPSISQLSAILFGLSKQVEAISALIAIGAEAAYLVDERKEAKAKTNAAKQQA
jgi:hypothetical protein